MSIRIPAPSDNAPVVDDEEAFAASESDDDDQDFGDWISDEADKRPCMSLFDDKSLPSATEALSYDKSTYGFDLNAICSKLSLDFHQRVRLINYIRKEKPRPAEFTVTGSEDFLSSDEYLRPAIEDDPLLLQIGNDDWSEDESGNIPPEDSSSSAKRIRILEEKLRQAKQELVDFHALVTKSLHASRIGDALVDPGPSNAVAPRDDDSHYFESYAYNDIHAVMIQDRVRTSTYASFIMKTPALFQNATVLDVGCGTGILSLFAARAGAKHVYAVDASPIAAKAEQIVKDNDMEDVITVIHGKIEDISLPVQHVDIIISEWMGYALLYESMLDSVLVARDRFLRPKPPGSVSQPSPWPDNAAPTGSEEPKIDVGGVMAPSECQMMFALCEASDIWKDRVGFWNDVYGFDLSVMADQVHDEAIVDIVSPDSLLTEPEVLRTIHLATATQRSLDFVSKFTLACTADRRSKAHAFLLYFDTFFAPDGAPIAPNTEVQLVREGDMRLAEVWPVGAGRRRESQGEGMIRRPSIKERKSSQGGGLKSPGGPRRRDSGGEGLKKEIITSFSTGPRSVPTHWKQTLFLLREPLVVVDGTEVSGSFHLRKSADNTRELDVEIHFTVTPPGGPAREEMVVQMFRVK